MVQFAGFPIVRGFDICINLCGMISGIPAKEVVIFSCLVGKGKEEIVYILARSFTLIIVSAFLCP